ncbi:MAG: LemA family protein [Candidatus Veblenbacteria bacterium]|nr:LemA family protein [Candidatus Veblenbacteria bacterium]MDZ4230122.1 LemA family protein [Candidatus Veblenbacteria bacterium]
MTTLTWIIVIAVAAVVLWLVATYNRLVSLKNRAAEGWSDIDVQLKRRYDLIPNLVQAVKGYAKHEDAVFTKVTEARTRAMGAQGVADKGAAENMLTGALKSLFAVAESYPDLKASANFLKLQDELSDTENKVQAARRFYNSMVRDLNTLIETFPSNVVANLFKFQKREFFEVGGEAERQAPQVNF